MKQKTLPPYEITQLKQEIKELNKSIIALEKMYQSELIEATKYHVGKNLELSYEHYDNAKVSQKLANYHTQNSKKLATAMAHLINQRDMLGIEVLKLRVKYAK